MFWDVIQHFKMDYHFCSLSFTWIQSCQIWRCRIFAPLWRNSKFSTCGLDKASTIDTVSFEHQLSFDFLWFHQFCSFWLKMPLSTTFQTYPPFYHTLLWLGHFENLESFQFAEDELSCQAKHICETSFWPSMLLLAACAGSMHFAWRMKTKGFRFRLVVGYTCLFSLVWWRYLLVIQANMEDSSFLMQSTTSSQNSDAWLSQSISPLTESGLWTDPVQSLSSQEIVHFVAFFRHADGGVRAHHSWIAELPVSGFRLLLIGRVRFPNATVTVAFFLTYTILQALSQAIVPYTYDALRLLITLFHGAKKKMGQRSFKEGIAGLANITDRIMKCEEFRKVP